MWAAETALAWLLGIGAAVAALGVILGVVPKLWKVFGWKGTFWAWTRRFAKTVDVIAELPTTLEAMDQRLVEHVGIAEAQRTEINEALESRSVAIDSKFDELTALVLDVRSEVKNNGGKSLKDGVDQIKADVQGLYARPGEPSVPGRTPTAPIPVRPPVKRSRRPKPETPA